MKITQKLRAWAIEKSLVADGADDVAVKAAISVALTADEGDPKGLSPEKFAELSVDETVKQATGVEALLKTLVEGQTALLQKLTQASSASATPAAKESAEDEPIVEKHGRPSFLEKSLASGGAHSASNGTHTIKVKGAEYQYSTVKTQAKYPEYISLPNGGMKRHPLAGQPVRQYVSNNLQASPYGEPRFMDEQSDLEKAVVGAMWRWQLHEASKSTGVRIPMREHDWQLVHYALNELAWSGVVKNGNLNVEGSEDAGAVEVKNRKLKDWEIKALIDDSTSGGLEAVPIVFDDAVILTPVLTNELFPSVTVVPITRGRRIEAVQVGNPTINSGGADDSDITLFSTTGLVSAFDTNIHVADMGIEIGLDFISDSPIDFAALFNRIYGLKMAEWLDRVIAVGNGTNEPEGIMSASGTTSVAFGSAAPTVGKYESLRVAVLKKYKQGFTPDRIVFCGSEVSYSRARGIVVGASDERRVLGEGIMGVMGYNGYALLEHRWAVNESMGNTNQFYAVLPRYRMYKRAGLQMKMTTEGKTLVRRNNMLITGRARWGGQFEDGGAAAVTTTAQA